MLVMSSSGCTPMFAVSTSTCRLFHGGHDIGELYFHMGGILLNNLQLDAPKANPAYHHFALVKVWVRESPTGASDGAVAGWSKVEFWVGGSVIRFCRIQGLGLYIAHGQAVG